MNLKIASLTTLLFIGNIAWSQSADSNRIIIKVLSFNIFHGATTLNNYDLNKIAEVIKDADPDFVALQEVDYNTLRNGKHDLVSELGYKLKMVSLFGRSMYFNGGEYGLGILSKHTFSKTRCVPLPGTPGSEPRSALEIITVLPSGDTIAFACTHFDHQKENDRIAQAEKINMEFTSSGLPVILAGDLNAKPESAPIIMLEKLWLPTYDILNPVPTFPSSRPSVKIDYVTLYPKEKWVTLKSEVICDSIASDHCALLVTVELLN
jgi:endonuclease/exonuclease/phosphatase family metal-dependent hydrolase